MIGSTAGCLTRDAGRSWLQRSAGLGGRDIFALKQAPNGTLVAGTNRGMFAPRPQCHSVASDELHCDRAGGQEYKGNEEGFEEAPLRQQSPRRRATLMRG